jgi:protein-S-isoprenylcysteine O-methyltransferase Ste14
MRMEKTSKENKDSEGTMTVWGVGPAIIKRLLPFIIVFVALHFIFFPLFLIPIPHYVGIFIGIILIIIGLPIYISSVKAIRAAFNSSKLITSGIYGHMRHPLYSAFILFITPGICWLFNSWILFFIPLIYYILFRVMIKEEEVYCLEKFGSDYEVYKSKVFAVIPKVKSYKKL